MNWLNRCLFLKLSKIKKFSYLKPWARGTIPWRSSIMIRSFKLFGVIWAPTRNNSSISKLNSTLIKQLKKVQDYRCFSSLATTINHISFRFWISRISVNLVLKIVSIILLCRDPITSKLSTESMKWKRIWNSWWKIIKIMKR